MLLVPTNTNRSGFSREDNCTSSSSAPIYLPKLTVSVIAVPLRAFDASCAQCWCGLGNLGSAHSQACTSASASPTTRHSHVITTQLDFPWQGEFELDVTAGQHAQHELRLIISGYRWEAHSNMGTFQYEARDLDEKDIASFALLDTLTRWLLPYWRGGTLLVRTNDVCVLRGIRDGDCGSRSGVWNAVRSLCKQYDVRLSAHVVEQLSSSSGIFNGRGGNTRDDRRGAGASHGSLRNPEVVNAAVKWLMGSGPEGSAVRRTMMSHLGV